MRETFVKKVASSFFENKPATVVNDITNSAGEIYIHKGSRVIITGKNSRNKEWLDIRFGQIFLAGIDPENLKLIHEDENHSWPIEADTLDLREYEFNIYK